MKDPYFLSDQFLIQIQIALRHWFSSNGILYPWRRHDLSAYHIVITECLLQRTRSETVEKYWSTFFELIPNWESLASVDITKLEQVLTPFGLVNQRSESLRKLAWAVIDRGNELPRSYEELIELPGVGQYIGSAIQVIVFNERAPFLDVNFARIVERLVGPRRLADIRDDPKLQHIAHKLINTEDCLIVNWAILDLAKKICRIRDPKCHECPLTENCLYFSVQQGVVTG